MSFISDQQAFLTGHNLSYSAVYFDQVMLAAKLANAKNGLATMHANRMIESLQHVGANFAHRLQQVERTAKAANLSIRRIPTLPPEFYPWADTRHKELLDFWPATNPAGCLFVVGHALGELRNGLIICNLTMDFAKNLQLDFTTQQASVPKRLQESLKRFGQAIQILESLPSSISALSLLRPFFDGVNTQLQTTIKLMEISDAGQEKAFTLNHKLLQILGNAELEISVHLSDRPD